MNTLADELRGHYAKPGGHGRVEMPLGPYPLNQAEKRAQVQTFAGEVRRLFERGYTRNTIGKKLGISPRDVGRFLRA